MLRPRLSPKGYKLAAAGTHTHTHTHTHKCSAPASLLRATSYYYKCVLMHLILVICVLMQSIPAASRAPPYGTFEYLYLCTSKASKLRIYLVHVSVCRHAADSRSIQSAALWNSRMLLSDPPYLSLPDREPPHALRDAIRKLFGWKPPRNRHAALSYKCMRPSAAYAALSCVCGLCGLKLLCLGLKLHCMRP